ncbi:hypothetical protein EXU48_21280 [Occultella glacieicola]|uniref:Helicase/secretion neighborhood TadE-like protein n=1 Tax=Occultella glacieicola TaxID=2518684 RepID=A0ABY2DZ53_9MICO|nr:Rv3654c family TadE-like protein [Occultella glacieicola]TDE89254.1 hypothetical protein EXU48_21280 [Occultella glacieicola]
MSGSTGALHGRSTGPGRADEDHRRTPTGADHRWTPTGARDRGSATILVLGIVASALVLAVLLGGLARVTGARGLAQGAADLAAIAGAEAAVGRTGDPCAAAATVARRHGVTLDSCGVSAGGLVTVEVGVAVTPLPGWSTRATAQARAGPVGLG